MKKELKKVPDLEQLAYYLAVFLTWGGLWALKVAIKKAMIEAREQEYKEYKI